MNFHHALHKDGSLSLGQRLEAVIDHWLEKGYQNSVTWAGFIENLEELNYTAVSFLLSSQVSYIAVLIDRGFLYETCIQNNRPLLQKELALNRTEKLQNRIRA